MWETLIARLKEAGMDTDAALRRFVGSAELYGKFLNKFPEDENFSRIAPALEKNDYEAVLTAAHTLKGVSGNLGMTRLFNACSHTVALIRAEKYDEAKQFYSELKAAYDEVCELLAGRYDQKR